MLIQSADIVLFQGDSITDAGRNRDISGDLGNGYAMMAAALFTTVHPETNVTFINRGISGDRTVELLARWQKDCLDLTPDVLSIMIGINDTWREIDSNMPMSASQFGSNYRSLLEQAQDSGINRFVIIEPFLLPNANNYDIMRVKLNEKIEFVRQLAREFAAVYIPLDGLFQQASSRVPAETWSGDGVHLTPAGNALAARAWLEAIGACRLES